MKKYFTAAIITLIYIPLITIGGELSLPLKNFIKTIFWHHWLGKGIMLIILFALVAAITPRAREEQKDEKYFAAFSWMAVIGALAILLFFTFEYFKHLT